MYKTNRKLPHEVFALIQEANKVEDRVKILQQYATPEIKIILQCSFNPNIEFDLPAGAPPYTPDKAPAGMQPTRLHKQINRLSHCLKNTGRYSGEDQRNKLKRESIFIQVLEIAHAKDAEILIAMKDKKLSKLYSTVTAALTRKAFPLLLP